MLVQRRTMANPATVVIAVATNLETRFVVVPLRSDTVGNLRERIKTGHMALFPDRGDVEVTSVEVELFGRRYRVEDTLSIGQIVSERQAALYVEVRKPLSILSEPSRLISSATTELNVAPEQDLRLPCGPVCIEQQAPIDVERRPSSMSNTIEIPRLNGSGAREVNTITEYESQLPGHCQAASPPGSHGEAQEQDTFELGQRQEVVQDLSCAVNDTLAEALNGTIGILGGASHDSDSTAKPQAIKKKRKLGLDVNVMGVRTIPAVGTEVSGAMTKKSRMGRGHLVMNMAHEESGVLTGPPTERNGVTKISVAVESINKSSGTGISKSSHSVPVSVSLHTEQADKADILGAILPSTKVSLQSIQEQKSGTSENSRGLKRHGSHIEGDNHRNHAALKSLSSSTTCESSGCSEGSQKDRATGRQQESKHHTDNGNNLEEVGKTDRLGQSPNGAERDQDNLNGGLSLPSSDPSESDTGESASEESEESERHEGSQGSEEVQLRVSRRGAAFFTPVNSGVVRRKDQRSSRGAAALDIKFQHLIDSQDGFDELISLSQQKPNVISGHEDEPQLHDGVQDSGAQLRLANDSLTVDLVPDTQVGDLNANFSSQDVEKDLMKGEHCNNDGSTKITLRDYQGLLVDSADVKEESKIAELSKAGTHEQGLKSNSRSSTFVRPIEIGEANVKLETVMTVGARADQKLESGEGPSQARSEDSQQIRAAVQLARMSMAEDAEGGPPENSPSKKRKKRREDVFSQNNLLLNFQEAVPGDLSPKEQDSQFVLQEKSKIQIEPPVKDIPAISHHPATSERLGTIEGVPLGTNSVISEKTSGEPVEKLSEKTVDVQYRDLHTVQDDFRLVTSDKGVKKKKLGLKRVKGHASLVKEDTKGTIEKGMQVARVESHVAASSDPGNKNDELVFMEETTKIIPEEDQSRLFVEFTENNSGRDQARKNHCDNMQEHKGHESTFVGPEIGLVSGRSLLQIDKIEDEKSKPKKDGFFVSENDCNTAGENEAETTAALVDEKKKLSKKSGQATKTPKRVRKIKDAQEPRHHSKEDGAIIPGMEISFESQNPLLPRLSVEEMEIANLLADVSPDKQQRSTVNLEETKSTPSSVIEKVKTKKIGSEIKSSKKQTKLEVAKEMEENLSRFATEHKPGTSKSGTELETPGELTGKKKKKKKRRPMTPESVDSETREPIEADGNEGLQQSHEEGEPTQSLLGNVIKSDAIDSSGKKPKKSRKELQVGSDNVELPLSSDIDRRLGGANQVKPTTGSQQVKPKASKESKKGDAESLKRNADGRFVSLSDTTHTAVSCPNGCGKVYSTKSSAFFRHKKSCIGRVPEV